MMSFPDEPPHIIRADNRAIPRRQQDGYPPAWVEERETRFTLPLPDRTAKEFTHTPNTEKLRTIDSQRDAYEQAVRQRWRALALCIKAKLEAVEAEIAEFEEEFLANILMPDGQTISHHIRPQVATAYETGHMPPLLTHGGSS